MIIELIGLPGSGKSTYVENLLKQSDNYMNPLSLYLYNDSRIKRNINKLKLIIGFFLTNVKEVVLLTILFKKIKFKNLKTELKMLAYLFSILGVYRKSKRKGTSKIIILDEGISQIIWAILYNSYESEKEVYELYRKLCNYWADEVWFINTDKDTIRERLLKRNNNGGSELQNDIKSREESLEESIKFLNKTMEWIKYSDIQKVNVIN